MPKKGYTDISILVDRSGSMSTIRDATIEGLNSFIQDQKDETVKSGGFARVTLAQFDDRYSVHYDNVPLAEFPILGDNDFQPRGMTALLDSIARLMNDTGVRLAKMDESDRPERVIFVIVTDGQENASREYQAHSGGYVKVKDMIQHQQEKYSWDVIFLGANIDVAAEQDRLGVASAMTYSATHTGTKGAFASASMVTRARRRGMDLGAYYLGGLPDAADVYKSFSVDADDLAIPTDKTRTPSKSNSNQENQ